MFHALVDNILCNIVRSFPTDWTEHAARYPDVMISCSHLYAIDVYVISLYEQDRIFDKTIFKI